MATYTEADAVTYELVHTALEAGRPMAETVADLAKSDHPRLKTHVWTFQQLGAMIETESYRAWRDDYRRVYNAHAEIMMAKNMADPSKFTPAQQAQMTRTAVKPKRRAAVQVEESTVTDTAALIGALDE